MRLMILMINTAVAMLLIIQILRQVGVVPILTKNCHMVVFLSSFDFGYDRVKNRRISISLTEVLRMYYKTTYYQFTGVIQSFQATF